MHACMLVIPYMLRREAERGGSQDIGSLANLVYLAKLQANERLWLKQKVEVSRRLPQGCALASTNVLGMHIAHTYTHMCTHNHKTSHCTTHTHNTHTHTLNKLIFYLVLQYLRRATGRLNVKRVFMFVCVHVHVCMRNMCVCV